MILLHSGAEPSNIQNREPFARRGKYRLLKSFLLLFVFVLLMGTTFWSVQWFSNSLNGFIFWNKNSAPDIFSGGIETSASNMIETMKEVKSTKFEKLHGGDGVNTREAVGLLIENNSLISAQAAVSVKISDGKETILFEKQPNQKLPIASLAKLMTALVVLEQYDVSHKVIIGEGAMKQEGDQGDLKLGQALSVKDLLYITLIESSNKSAYALAGVMGNYKFIDVMNERAGQLGLKGTYFVDSTGVRSGSRSTVLDLVLLSRYLFENYPLFREIISIREFDLYLEDGAFHHKLINTNKLLGEVPTVIGGKTGWTKDAKGCVMVIEANPENEDYLIHIVLGSDDRFEDMKKLISISEFTNK